MMDEVVRMTGISLESVDAIVISGRTGVLLPAGGAARRQRKDWDWR